MEIEKAIEILKKQKLFTPIGQAAFVAMDALEKQVPNKPNVLDCCTKCDTYLKDDNGVEGDYCPNCGQKVDWSV